MRVTAISQDLHNTVKRGEHIEEVYFTEQGDHYFTKHELVERVEVKRNGNVSFADKKTGKFYGSLKVEAKTEVAIARNGATNTRTYMAGIANPDALIVLTLSRDEVLDLPTFKVDYKQAIDSPDIALECRRAKMEEGEKRGRKKKEEEAVAA